MGVAAEIGQCGGWSRERFFAVDEPLGLFEWREVGGKRLLVAETGMVTEEVQQTLAMRGIEFLEHQPAKEAGEHTDRQEEARLAGDPVFAIKGEAAAGHDHMDMRMEGHCRSPAMENGGDTDPCAEMFGIGGDGDGGLGGGLEQEIIDHRFVLIGNVSDLGWQGEDDMVIGHRQQFGLAGSEPVLCRRSLTFWTVAIPATVIGDMTVSTVLASCDMPAKRCRAAGFDRRHRLMLAEADMAGVSVTPCRPMVAEDVRDLQRWSPHEGWWC